MKTTADSTYVLSPIALDTMMQQFGEIITSKIELAISEAKKKDDHETFISSAVARKMFSPSISINTLKAWTREGLLKDYRFGRKIFYKKGEVTEAGKTLRKYGRRALS